MNQVRIRDVVEQDESMFEIHKLENIHVVSGINTYSSEYFIQTFMEKVTLVPAAEMRRIQFQSFGFCVQVSRKRILGCQQSI